MSASTTAVTSSAGMRSSSAYTTSAFWERLWRTAGIQSVLCFLVAYIVYGHQPQVGASVDTLAAFYDGGRTRILIAVVFSGLGVLNLMWFAAALRTTLADAGQDGWGAAATAASAALGGLFLLLITVVAALAYSIAGSGNTTLTSGLNDFAWTLVVLTSFPRAMLGYVRGVWALAGAADLERALLSWSCRGRTRIAGRHHVAEGRILGTGRCLFTVRLAHHRRRVGRGRKPRPPNPTSCYPN